MYNLNTNKSVYIEKRRGGQLKSIVLTSRAKINLSIDVVGKRDDGYHLVEMIMQTIDLKDKISLEPLEEDEIIITSDSEYVPLNEGNIAYKAAKILKDKFDIKKGIKINIQKNIPIAAGMAGGSSNGAAVLVGLNKIWNLNLNQEELMDIGLSIGADVPFCIKGGACLATGIGEELVPIKGLKNTWIVICKPNFSVSTPWVYKNLNLNEIKERPDTQKLLNYIEEENIISLSKEMKNVLEEVTKKEYKAIEEIEKKMIEYGALGSMMTGSGPTVFGIFKDYKIAKNAALNLSKFYKSTFLTKTFVGGIEIERGNK